jgi:hypothetical protein
VAPVISISPGAQPDLGHAAIRDRADVGSLAARVNADAIPTVCCNIKAARPTLTPHPCAAVHGAHNLRVQSMIGRSGDVRHRKRVNPGIAVTPVFAKLPPTSEFFASAETSDDAATSLSNAIRVIVRTGPDFTSPGR